MQAAVVHVDDEDEPRALASETFHENGFSWSRDSPQLAQRFRVTIANDGRTMRGEGMMKKEGTEWEPDLQLSYVRIP
jgi:CheY-like chemotaxis protein